MNITYDDLNFTLIKNLSDDGREKGDVREIISSFFSDIKRDANWKMAEDVTFIILLFLKHHLKNT